MRPVEAADVRAVAIQLGSGSLTLTASDDDTVTGMIDSPDPATEESVTVATFGRELRITAPDRMAFGPFGAEIHVRLSVPRGTELVATTGSADVSADLPLGRCRIKSGSGDLQLAAAEQLHAQTGSGDIAVLEVSEAADVITGSGDIRVDTSHSGLSLRSASGDIRVGSVHGDLQAKTASGDLGIGATTASVTAKTASGDVTIGVADSLPAWLDLKSVSGEVDIAIPPTREPEEGEPYVSLYIRSGSGDIHITRA